MRTRRAPNGKELPDLELACLRIAQVPRGHQHQRRLRAGDLRLVLRMAQEGKIPGAGRAQRGNPVNHCAGRAAGSPGVHDGRNLVRREGKLHDR